MTAQLALDVARIVVAGGGALIAALQLRLMRGAVASGQRWGFGTLALACAVFSAERVGRIGDPLTWEFGAATAVLAAAAVATAKRRHEQPAQPRPGPWGPSTRHRAGRGDGGS